MSKLLCVFAAALFFFSSPAYSNDVAPGISAEITVEPLSRKLSPSANIIAMMTIVNTGSELLPGARDMFSAKWRPIFYGGIFYGRNSLQKNHRLVMGVRLSRDLKPGESWKTVIQFPHPKNSESRLTTQGMLVSFDSNGFERIQRIGKMNFKHLEFEVSNSLSSSAKGDMGPSLLFLLLIGFGGWAYTQYLAIGSCLWQRLLAAFSLGCVLFVLSVNFFLIAKLKMDAAIGVSLFLFVLAGFSGLMNRQREKIRNYTLWEYVYLGVAGSVILFRNVQSYLKILDNDFYIHYPVIWMFRDGIFPHVNPNFPDVLMKGHYARDLLMGGLSRLTGLLPEHALFFFGIWIATANFFLCYIVLREILKNPRSAFAVTTFLYFCLSSGHSYEMLRSGLIEASHGNSPLVILWCLVIIAQLNRFYQKGKWTDAILAGISIGALGFVYEAYLPFVLLASVTAFAVGCKYFSRYKSVLPKVTLLIFFVFIWMFTQGGVFTDWAEQWKRAQFRNETVVDQANMFQQEFSGLTQQASVKFPKTPFLHWTDSSGKRVPILSADFLRNQGLPLFFSIPMFIYFVFKKQPFGSAMALIGFGTLLITSMFDLGRMEPESFRLLFLSALGAGAAYVLGFYQILKQLRLNKVFFFGLTALFLLLHSGVFVSKSFRFFQRGVSYSSNDPSSDGNSFVSVMQLPFVSEVDRKAMAGLRGEKESGRLLTNYPFVWQEQPQFNNSRLLLSAWSGKPAAGFGHGIPVRDTYSLELLVYALGFRAIAYWNSGAPELLESMKVKWLYLFPDSPDAANLDHWEKMPGLDKVIRYPDTGSGERLLLKAKPVTLPRWQQKEEPLFTFSDATRLWQKAEYREMEIEFKAPLPAAVTIRQILSYETVKLQVNPNDKLIQVIEAGSQKARLRVVAPFIAGKYQCQFQFLSEGGDWQHLAVLPLVILVTG